MELTISAADPAELSQLLLARGVLARETESKGLDELQTLIVAVGGGVGISGIIKPIASAIVEYFKNSTARETSRNVDIVMGDMKISVTGKDSVETIEAWLKTVRRLHDKT